MLEKPAEIIDGIHLMMLALDVKEAHVGVENNKMDAAMAEEKNDECEALGAESEKLENYATELKKYARGEVKEEPVAPECFDANFAVKASSGEDLFLGM